MQGGACNGGGEGQGARHGGQKVEGEGPDRRARVKGESKEGKKERREGGKARQEPFV
jgi:hypothetical protein